MNNSGTQVLNGPFFNSVTIFEQWGLAQEIDSYLKLVAEGKLKNHLFSAVINREGLFPPQV